MNILLGTHRLCNPGGQSEDEAMNAAVYGRDRYGKRGCSLLAVVCIAMRMRLYPICPGNDESLVSAMQSMQGLDS